MKYSAVRAAVRLGAFLGVTTVLLPIYLLVIPFGKTMRRMISYPFFRSCVYLTGLCVRETGARSTGAGMLFVPNHVSYLDIPVLATLRDGVFVAKSEVRCWPVFGFLAKISQTIFVSRTHTKVLAERLAIANRLALGHSIFLFPEGSSSDGTGVLPFRPGLLSAALADDDLDVMVQPVSIVYGPPPDLQGGPRVAGRADVAWYGDMELIPHLWRVFGRSQRTTVTVHFHPPRRACEFSSRRALALWAERSVAVGMRRTRQDRAA